MAGWAPERPGRRPEVDQGFARAGVAQLPKLPCALEFSSEIFGGCALVQIMPLQRGSIMLKVSRVCSRIEAAGLARTA